LISGPQVLRGLSTGPRALPSNLAVAMIGSSAPYACTWLVATTGSPISPALYVLALSAGALLAAVRGLPVHASLVSGGPSLRPVSSSPARAG